MQSLVIDRRKVKRSWIQPVRLYLFAFWSKNKVESESSTATCCSIALAFFGNTNPLGAGGIPAPGEIAARDWILYGMPEVKTLGSAKVLVVGGGHSAATVIRELTRLSGT